MRFAPLFLLAFGCDQAREQTTDTTTASGAAQCGAPYVPFDAANYENQSLRVGAYEQIVALRKGDNFSAADFATIEDLYVNTAELQVTVQGRTDDHSFASVIDTGVDLDAAIMAAVADGASDLDIAVQGQIIDKTLQHFFTLSVYHEGMKSADEANPIEDMQAGWDGGFGYLGVSNDGTEASGIAKTLASRDEEFQTSTLDLAFNGLLTGRCGLAASDTAATLAALDDVDGAMLHGMALSVVHEMDEYTEDPLIKGWEGLLFWNIVDDYVRTLDSNAADTIDAEFAKGVDRIDAALVREELAAVLGLAR
jgi:hypothetical protein